MTAPRQFGRLRPWYSALRVISGGGGAWSPDDVLAGVTNSFWSDPLAGTLYEDAGLTTLADATNDPVGGVRNLSAIGTSTLSQSTTGNKFIVSADGRLQRTGATNTQVLLGSGSITLSNGFVFAADVEIPAASTFRTFFSAEDSVANRLIVVSNSASLIACAGSTVQRTVSSVFTAGNLRHRVIVTGNATDFVIVVNGGAPVTYLTGSSLTTFPSWAIGKLWGSTSPNGMTFGRLLVAEKDLRANIAEIDAWLGGA